MVHIGNTFEQAIAKFYSESDFSLLQETVIGIMGAGGLGSNCAVNLARSGIRHFIIADYDRVEMSNLNRQYYFPHQVGQFKVDALQDILTEINPNITVVTYREALTKDSIPTIYDAADILIEAFDSADAKSMFVEGTLSMAKPKIMVSGLAGIGKSDDLTTKKIGTDIYVIGDETSDIADDNPYAPRVSIAAAKQADVALSIVLDKGRD